MLEACFVCEMMPLMSFERKKIREIKLAETEVYPQTVVLPILTVVKRKTVQLKCVFVNMFLSSELRVNSFTKKKFQKFKKNSLDN